MNQVTQGESYSGPSIHPLKRKRGRPRKFPSLKHAEGARAPPGFDGAKEHLPQRADNTVGIGSIVGQTVTGVVEATFDAGYLLSVRIGNSNTNLRGVVFKPGHYAPVTAENDVAPHVKMIKRNDQGFSRNPKPAMQTAGTVMLKHKDGPPKTAPSVLPGGTSGSVVPVAFQPVNYQNGLPSPHQLPSNPFQTADVSASEHKDVHVIEPVSMLLPNQSISVGQGSEHNDIGSGNKDVHVIEPVSMLQPNQSIPVGQGSEHNDNGLFTGGAVEAGQGDEAKLMTSTGIDTLASSEMSDIKTDSGKEAMKSSSEDLGIVSKEETGNPSELFSVNSMQMSSATEPLFNYGTGRMTELLQAVQGNMKETQVQIAERPTSAPEFEFDKTNTSETDSL